MAIFNTAILPYFSCGLPTTIPEASKKIVIIETRRFMDGPLDNNIIGHLRETKYQERDELKETDHSMIFKLDKSICYSFV